MKWTSKADIFRSPYLGSIEADRITKWLVFSTFFQIYKIHTLSCAAQKLRFHNFCKHTSMSTHFVFFFEKLFSFVQWHLPYFCAKCVRISRKFRLFSEIAEICRDLQSIWKFCKMSGHDFRKLSKPWKFSWLRFIISMVSLAVKHWSHCAANQGGQNRRTPTCNEWSPRSQLDRRLAPAVKWLMCISREIENAQDMLSLRVVKWYIESR